MDVGGVNVHFCGPDHLKRMNADNLLTWIVVVALDTRWCNAGRNFYGPTIYAAARVSGKQRRKRKLGSCLLTYPVHLNLKRARPTQTLTRLRRRYGRFEGSWPHRVQSCDARMTFGPPNLGGGHFPYSTLLSDYAGVAGGGNSGVQAIPD